MNNSPKLISTEEVYKLLNNPDCRIIDVRSVDAYNGWRLKNEIRGGHIKNAKSLPVKWTDYIEWIEIVKSKGILPDHTIVLYGYNTEESGKVTKLFTRAGYNDIRIYNHFIKEWCSNPDLPMTHLKRYNKLVPPEWINGLISGNTPREYNGNSYVICHAHYRNCEDYAMGHIPGAIELDTLTLESPKTWNLRTPSEIKETLESKGISHNTTVILYGRFSYPDINDPYPGSSAGHLGAFRCAFIMMYAGVKDVRVLNGGIQSWEDAGYELTTGETEPSLIDEFGAEIPARPELAIDVPEAKELLESDTGDLISVRSWLEFIGKLSGYNYIEKKGRIPGAIFGNCGSDAYHMENYRNLDYTTREYHEIAEMWSEANILPEKHNAFYCGTGWRGSEAFYNAYLMGWPKISVFDGGWFEWSNDPNNPYETGVPE
ncbi:sulfurtransferase [Bacteroidota bacterium]